MTIMASVCIWGKNKVLRSTAFQKKLSSRVLDPSTPPRLSFFHLQHGSFLPSAMPVSSNQVALMHILEMEYFKPLIVVHAINQLLPIHPLLNQDLTSLDDLKWGACDAQVALPQKQREVRQTCLLDKFPYSSSANIFSTVIVLYYALVQSSQFLCL